MSKYVVNTLLWLDKVLLNVYGSFGHTSVIIYWCIDNYGYQSWPNDLYYTEWTYPTLWNDGKNQNMKIRIYMCMRLCRVCSTLKDMISMPLHLFQIEANRSIDSNHVEILIIWEKV